jgi:hypothetical protein
MGTRKEVVDGERRRYTSTYPDENLPMARDATFHAESHTQAGSWSDLGNHVLDWWNGKP